MPKRLRWRFTFAISPRFNSRRWNLQELCSVRRSTNWQSLVSYGKSHVTNDALKTASQNAKFQYDPKERTPPGFHPRSLDFVLQLTFGAKWSHTKFGVKPLKPGGLASKMSLWACFTCFQRCLCVKPLTVPITSTTSIINDHTFSSSNAVIHTLYQPFRVINPEYVKFLDFKRVILPTQEQVDEMERGIVLCPEGQLSDEDIWEAYQQHSDSTIMTVYRKGVQRIKDIIVRHLFPGRPISNIPCASVADANAIFPHKQMHVIFM